MSKVSRATGIYWNIPYIISHAFGNRANQPPETDVPTPLFYSDSANALFGATGRFDLRNLRWTPEAPDKSADPAAIIPRDTVAWLVRSGLMRGAPVAMIGTARNAIIARAAEVLIAAGGAVWHPLRDGLRPAFRPAGG
jgi:hypothetical protein